MTGADLKNLNTEIRGGRSMDSTIFYILLNTERKRLENKRPWRSLLSSSTAVYNAGETYTTERTLPTGFIRFPVRDKMKLVLNGLEQYDLVEIKYEERHKYANTNGYFYCNYATGKYYLTGTYGTSYDIYINAIVSGGTITAATDFSTNTFLSNDTAPILAFAVAVIDEMGMDYDEINAKQANGNAITARAIESTMVKQDDNLIRSALRA